MALFLSESTYVEDTRSLSDVLIEGIEIAQEFGALSEAILRADYILDQKCKTLNESAALTLQEGFLSNVGEKIMEAGRKVIQWIKDIAKKVKDKVVEIYNRIKDRVTGNSLDVAKSKIANLEATVTFIEANGKLQEQIAKATNADVVKSLEERATKLKEEFDKKKEANGKLEGTQTVSITYYEKLVKAAQYNEKVAVAVTNDLEKSIKELEAKLKQSNDDLAKSQAENASIKSERDKAATRGMSQANTISQLGRENTKLANSNSALHNANSGLRDELATVKAQLAAQKQLTATASTALAALQAADASINNPKNQVPDTSFKSNRSNRGIKNPKNQVPDTSFK